MDEVSKSNPTWGGSTEFERSPYSWLDQLLNPLQLAFHYRYMLIATHSSGLWNIQFQS